MSQARSPTRSRRTTPGPAERVQRVPGQSIRVSLRHVLPAAAVSGQPVTSRLLERAEPFLLAQVLFCAIWLVISACDMYTVFCRWRPCALPRHDGHVLGAAEELVVEGVVHPVNWLAYFWNSASSGSSRSPRSGRSLPPAVEQHLQLKPFLLLPSSPGSRRRWGHPPGSPPYWLAGRRQRAVDVTGVHFDTVSTGSRRGSLSSTSTLK